MSAPKKPPKDTLIVHITGDQVTKQQAKLLKKHARMLKRLTRKLAP